MTSKTNRARVLLLLAFLVCLSGCGVKSTPPGPQSFYGMVGDAHFRFLKWDEGLAVMLLDNVEGSHYGGSSASTSDPVRRCNGSGGSPDGHHYEWTLETSDGETATFQLNGVDYDLAEGAFFIIRSNGEQVDVVQLDRDLSDVEDDPQSCVAFLKADQNAMKLISGEPKPEDKADE